MATSAPLKAFMLGVAACIVFLYVTLFTNPAVTFHTTTQLSNSQVADLHDQLTYMQDEIKQFKFAMGRHEEDIRRVKAAISQLGTAVAQNASVKQLVSEMGEVSKAAAKKEPNEVDRKKAAAEQLVNEMEEANKAAAKANKAKSTLAKAQRLVASDVGRKKDAVRNMMQLAWDAYKRYAWGSDELEPLMKRGNQHWGGFAATMLDALDTLWLMGMKAEFEEAAAHIEANLTFDKDHKVSVFETTIRALGGLCAAFMLSGNDVFLRKAKELGDRLLPAFDTPSGLPASLVNLRTGQRDYFGWMGGNVILSEVGSVQIELRALSSMTKDPRYAAKGDRAMDSILANRAEYGLFVDRMNWKSGAPSGYDVGIGAFNDSFYEYLLKLWLQSGKKEKKFRDKWDAAVDGFHKRLLHKSGERLFISGTATEGKMEHLSCFLPGALALGSATSAGTAGEKHAARDLTTAKTLLDTCIAMYTSTATGLAGDIVDYSLKPLDPEYKLRPETVESLFWLYTVTKEERYRDAAWRIFESIKKYCSASKQGGVGYGAHPNVQSTGGRPLNKMESFFLGETLKYLYLIFDEDATKLEWHERHVFTTEAHVVDTAA